MCSPTIQTVTSSAAAVKVVARVASPLHPIAARSSLMHTNALPSLSNFTGTMRSCLLVIQGAPHFIGSSILQNARVDNKRVVRSSSYDNDHTHALGHTDTLRSLIIRLRSARNTFSAGTPILHPRLLQLIR